MGARFTRYGKSYAGDGAPDHNHREKFQTDDNNANEGQMSKTDRAKKRAAEKASRVTTAPVGMPRLAPVKRREGNGRVSRAGVTRDPQAEMLKARCRRWGKPTSQWREMRDPWWGCEAGGAMALATSKLAERKALWDAICWTRQTVINLDRAIGAPNRHAQCLRLMLALEEMSADSTTPAPDERTDVEKEDDAVRAYQWLGEILGRCGNAVRAECLRVVADDEKARDVGALTYALRNISRHIDPRALT